MENTQNEQPGKNVMTVGLSEPNENTVVVAGLNESQNNTDKMSWGEYVKMCYIPPHMGSWINDNLNKIRSGTVSRMPHFIE